ncbi:MAG TPA: hypothetical protein VGI14_07500 [Casimicrobiaceae bacterium]|jgi:hypothetical protein
MRTRARQRGWIGLIGLLLALLIVFLLGKTVMQQMGLLNGTAKPATAAARPSNVQADVATPPPMEALERARGLEAQVQQQAREQMERIDKASQ